jgi:hypothetical protein
MALPVELGEGVQDRRQQDPVFDRTDHSEPQNLTDPPHRLPSTTRNIHHNNLNRNRTLLRNRLNNPSLPAWILLRTRSVNTHHLQLLDTVGFKHLLTVPNDRDPGVGSIYLGRKR